MADDIIIKTFSYKHDKLPDPSFQIIDCRKFATNKKGVVFKIFIRITVQSFLDSQT